MNKETLRMQMLAGIITESQYKKKLNESKFGEFFKNIFSSKADKEGAEEQKLAQAAQQAAEAAAQKASDEEVTKLEGLLSDPEFKKEVNAYADKLFNDAEGISMMSHGDRGYADDVYSDGMKEYFRKKGINPSIIKNFITTLHAAMK